MEPGFWKAGAGYTKNQTYWRPLTSAVCTFHKFGGEPGGPHFSLPPEIGDANIPLSWGAYLHSLVSSSVTFWIPISMHIWTNYESCLYLSKSGEYIPPSEWLCQCCVCLHVNVWLIGVCTDDNVISSQVSTCGTKAWSRHATQLHILIIWIICHLTTGNHISVPAPYRRHLNHPSSHYR